MFGEAVGVGRHAREDATRAVVRRFGGGSRSFGSPPALLRLEVARAGPSEAIMAIHLGVREAHPAWRDREF